MTIIPYVKPGCLQSDTKYHFKSLQEAATWAFYQMENKPDDSDSCIFRFRIIDTEEDISFMFDKRRDEISRCIGWMNLCGFNPQNLTNKF